MADTQDDVVAFGPCGHEVEVAVETAKQVVVTLDNSKAVPLPEHLCSNGTKAIQNRFLTLGAGDHGITVARHFDSCLS